MLVDEPEMLEIVPLSELKLPPLIPSPEKALPVIALMPVCALITKPWIPAPVFRAVPVTVPTVVAEFRDVFPPVFKIPPFRPVAEMLPLDPLVTFLLPV